MSAHIEYRHLALGYSTAQVSERWEQVTGERRLIFDDTVYMVFVECGASNCTMFKRGKDGREREVLERRWDIAAIGTQRDVVAHACRIAPSTEGGMTKLRNAGPSGWVQAETYIRHYRNTVAQAVDGVLSECSIAGRVVRFHDADGAVKECAWLRKAKAEGRLTERPALYQAEGNPTRFDTVFSLSNNRRDGSLACDLMALATVFKMKAEYPHFYFEHGIGLEIERAYDRAVHHRERGRTVEGRRIVQATLV